MSNLDSMGAGMVDQRIEATILRDHPKHSVRILLDQLAQLERQMKTERIAIGPAILTQRPCSLGCCMIAVHG